MRRRDLLVLTADADQRAIVEALLARRESLGIRPLEADVRRYDGRDAGMRARGPEVVVTQRALYEHLLLVLDYEGSGAASGAEAVEQDLESRLALTWGSDAVAVVVEPEVEEWMIGAANKLLVVERQQAGIPDPRAWWRANGFWPEGQLKPADPKRAVRALAAAARTRPDAASFREAMSKASFRSCQSRSFKRLEATLKAWFGATPSTAT